MEYPIPIIELKDYERTWLTAVHKMNFEGQKFSFKELYSALFDQLPKDFKPSQIDSRLISHDGETIKLLGVLALFKSSEFLNDVNKVILTIQTILKKSSQIERIKISDISESSGYEANNVSYILRLIYEYGEFYRGSSNVSHDSNILGSIEVTGSDNIWFTYMHFQGIEVLVFQKEHTQQKVAPESERFSGSEILDLNAQLDELRERLETLENNVAVASEAIWTDMINGFEEMKDMFFLSRKNWHQLFLGKVMDATRAGVIDRIVSKEIVDQFYTPFVTKLIDYFSGQ